jgi:DNA-binding IclR family transcriptional regulator
MMVLRLVAQHELSADQIAVAVGVGCSTAFRCLEKFVDGGVVGLLHRDYKSGAEPTLQGQAQVAFVDQLLLGILLGATDAQAWIKERTRTGWP